MKYKQALAVLSDFMIKCEDVDIALPDDPLNAVITAIRALEHEAKHEMVGRRQMEAALAHMRQQCGVAKPAKGSHIKAQTLVPRFQPAIAAAAENASEEESSSEVEEEETLGSGTDEEMKTPPKKSKPPVAALKPKMKLQDEVASKPAKCVKNQPLVDQFVKLGEYEMKHGHTQRGIARLRAAKELRDTDESITSGAQARKLDRVGQSAAAKIDAILHGGLKNALREYTSE